MASAIINDSIFLISFPASEETITSHKGAHAPEEGKYNQKILCDVINRAIHQADKKEMQELRLKARMMKSIIRLRKIIVAPAPKARAVSFVKLNRKNLFMEVSYAVTILRIRSIVKKKDSVSIKILPLQLGFMFL